MKNNKKKFIIIRITESEKKALQEFAAKKEATISDVIRERLFVMNEAVIKVES